MRHIYIAGNWKMNKTLPEVLSFIGQLRMDLEKQSSDLVTPVIFPPNIYLEKCIGMLPNNPLKIGAQDVSSYDAGAYTGEVSAGMLKAINTAYCLVGHSERRQYHNESSLLVNKKAKVLLANGITPFICVGELESEREMGITERVIRQQLEESIGDISTEADFVIAYEPVWAIGTGKTATPEIAQEVHGLIRGWLASHYDNEKAAQTSILYGGSIKTDNFPVLIAQEDIDGGLIGGTSLDADSFYTLIKTGLDYSKSITIKEHLS